MEGIVGRLLSFDKMMAGSIIKVLYYIGLAAITIGALWGFLGRLFGGEFVSALIALVLFPIGILFLRVICEMYIVLFRISDNLAALRKLKEGESGTVSASSDSIT